MWRDFTGYASALAIVLGTFVLTRLLIASGVHVPRMLLYIAAVAIAARAFGTGPGIAAMLASIVAIVLPSLERLLHNAAFAERFVAFLVCAVIAILVSVSREEPRVRHPVRADDEPVSDVAERVRDT